MILWVAILWVPYFSTIPEPTMLPELITYKPRSHKRTLNLQHNPTQPELIEPVPSTSQENGVQLENDDPLSEINISVESNVSTDPNNITCIFCDQKAKKHRFKNFPLFYSIKKTFYQKQIKRMEIMQSR